MPVLLFSAFLAMRVSTEERARVERDMVDVNRALAAALDRELLVTVGVLELLAQSAHLTANDLPAFYAEARGPKEIWEVPGSGHIGGIDTQPAEYEQRVVGFFDRSLLAG